MKNYFDSAATSVPSKKCIQDLMYISDILGVWGNPSSLYTKGQEAKKILEASREKIAKTINADPEEIIFTSSGSEANNLAIKGVVLKEPFIGAIVCSNIEHPSVYNTCKYLNRILPIHELDLNNSYVYSTLSSSRTFSSIMMANNEIGTLPNIKKLCELVHQRNGIFHTDAVQAWCHMPINVKDLGVDLLSASSHKINSIRGAGFLYKKKDIELEPLIHGGHQEFGLRAGTENVIAIYCMAQEAERKHRTLWTQMEATKILTEFAWDQIKQIFGNNVILNGPEINKRLPGNLNIQVKGVNNQSLVAMMDMFGYAISAGSACTEGENKPSRILKAIGLSDEEAQNSIRVTITPDHTKIDIVNFVDTLQKSVNYLKEE